jgi:hypothetical protein
MLYYPELSVATTPRELRGTFLAKNRLPPRIRAQLAADILDRRAMLTKLTVRQVAELCRVSTAMVGTARNDSRPGRSADLTLLRAWTRATPQQRQSFVRNAGPDDVWSVLSAAL